MSTGPGTPTFRVFVSSTFDDMIEERNALQSDVFRRLRALCAKHGCRFQGVDLRWGTRDEAALDQQTMKICQTEIARCQKVSPRPNFIVLLGDRYGWCPLPSEIEASLYERMLSVTDDPGNRELLSTWYLRDDNAVPPVFDLQPRRGQHKDHSRWGPIERRLRAVFQEASLRLGLPEATYRELTASATEQEIVSGVLTVAEPERRVACFFRRIVGLPNNASAAPYLDLDDDGRPDREARDRLQALKDELCDLLPRSNRRTYDATWTGNGISLGHIDKLCHDVYEWLERAIIAEIGAWTQQDDLVAENAQHAAFGQERVQAFSGRTQALETIATYLVSGASEPLVVHGSSGLGKSALLAEAVRRAQQTLPQAVVIARYVGATPASSDAQSLLADLWRQILRAYHLERELPLGWNELARDFGELLESAKEGPPLVLFVDGLDQLTGGYQGRTLAWLPLALPPHVHFVTSTSTGELSEEMLRLPHGHLLELTAMSPSEGCSALDYWLAQRGRTLQPHQRQAVVDRFTATGLPLHLKLAFEEAVRWKSYSPAAETLASPDVPAAIRALFARLSSDANHGELLVSRSLGYLAAARTGLAEDELIDILSADEDVLTDFTARAHHSLPDDRLPFIVWSRLFFDLEPYLTNRALKGTMLLTFFHRQLQEVAAADLLAGDTAQQRHKALASYFTNRWRDPSLHAIVELPFQLTGARRLDQAIDLLSSTEYLQARLDLDDSPLDTGEELRRLAERLPSEQLPGRFFVDFTALFERQLPALVSPPRCVLSQLYASIRGTAAADAAAADWITREVSRMQEAGLPWLRQLDRVAIDEGVVILVADGTAGVPGHRAPVTGLCAYANGSRAISVAQDGAAILWDLDARIALTAFVDQPDALLACAVSPDGQIAVIGDSAGQVTIWQLSDSPRCVRTFRDAQPDVPEIMCCALSPDGHTLAYGLGDGKFKLVPLAPEGRQAVYVYCLPRTSGTVSFAHDRPPTKPTPDLFFPVTRAEFFPSARGLLVFSWFTGRCERRSANTFEVEVHYQADGPVTSACLSADGRRVVAGTQSGRLSLYDPDRSNPLWQVDAHRGAVNDCAFGGLSGPVITAGRDRMLKQWDLTTGRLLGEQPVDPVARLHWVERDHHVLVGARDGEIQCRSLSRATRVDADRGHRDRVTCVAVAADGNVAVSVAEDGSVIRWAISEELRLMARLEETPEIWSCAVRTDGAESAFGCTGGQILLWDHESGNTRSLGSGSHPTSICRYNRERSELVTADTRGAATGWDTSTGMRLWSLPGQLARVQACSLVMGGRQLLTCNARGETAFHRTRDGEKTWSLDGSVSWIGDGGGLLVESLPGRIRLLDPFLRETLATLPICGNEPITCLVPPRRHVAAVVTDTGASIWVPHNEEMVASFITPKRVTCADLGDDRLALGMLDGAVSFFDIENLPRCSSIGGDPVSILVQWLRCPPGKSAFSRRCLEVAYQRAFEAWRREDGALDWLRAATRIWSSVVREELAAADPALARTWDGLPFREQYLTVGDTAYDHFEFMSALLWRFFEGNQ